MNRATKNLAYWCYQKWTGRQRQMMGRKLSSCQQWPAAILFYHRVADTLGNDWSISRRNFAQHMDWLTQHANMVSLANVQQAQRIGSRGRLSVTITFDDGYSENSEWAIPELVRRNIPCTYFVATHFVKTGESFPHDAAHGRRLAPNSIDEIRRMADAGIEIGAHTFSHLNLGEAWPRRRLLEEIRDARHELQDWTGQNVNYFAVPYGLPENISQAAIDVVCEAGFLGFMSAYGGWNWPGEDSFHLQRIHGDSGLATLTNWLTLDPRKLQRGSQIKYTRPNACCDEPTECTSPDRMNPHLISLP